MVISKILEATLTAGTTTVTFTDTEIPNSIITTSCSDPDLYPVERSLSGNTVTLTYEKQSADVYVALYIIKDGVEIIDSLDSDSDAKALSAKQGKVLKDLIDNLGVPALNDLTDVDFDSLSDGDILKYDGVSEVWINEKDNISNLSDVVINNISDGQILVWDDNGQKFKNQNPPSGSFSETLLCKNTVYDSASGTANVNKSYTLNDSLNNYDAVIVYGWMYNVTTQTDNNRSNLMSMMVFKSDFYDVAINQGQPTTNPFMLNGSSNSARRSMAFQFSDDTHITTAAIRTEAYVEPILEKVVGLKF